MGVLRAHNNSELKKEQEQATFYTMAVAAA